MWLCRNKRALGKKGVGATKTELLEELICLENRHSTFIFTGGAEALKS